MKRAMENAVASIRSSRLFVGFAGRRLILSAFRFLAFTAAIIPLVLFPNDVPSLLPPAILIAAALLYTIFKLAHPLQWYRSKPAGALLIGVDLAVALALVFSTGGIESPFMLYALAPVLTVALLLPPRITVAAALLTGVMVFSMAILMPQQSRVETIEHVSLASIYFLALGVLASLPYTINTASERRLRSAAIIDERHRLGREMHDGVCQTIYGLRWELQMFESATPSSAYLRQRLSYLAQVLEQAEQEIRGTLELLSAGQGDRPLLPQVRSQLDQLHSDMGIAVRLEADGEPDLDAMVRNEVLFICLEALRNVAKHSGAQAVTVNVLPKNGRLRLEVVDDGGGFQPNSHVGHGLTIMEERARSVGGRLSVASAPGKGTQVLLEVPRCVLD